MPASLLSHHLQGWVKAGLGASLHTKAVLRGWRAHRDTRLQTGLPPAGPRAPRPRHLCLSHHRTRVKGLALVCAQNSNGTHWNKTNKTKQKEHIQAIETDHRVHRASVQDVIMPVTLKRNCKQFYRAQSIYTNTGDRSI